MMLDYININAQISLLAINTQHALHVLLIGGGARLHKLVLTLLKLLLLAPGL